MKVPPVDLKAQNAKIKDEVNAAIMEVVRDSMFVLGPAVETFELNIAEYLEVRHAIGVSSGTDALLLSLMALGVGP